MVPMDEQVKCDFCHKTYICAVRFIEHLCKCDMKTDDVVKEVVAVETKTEAPIVANAAPMPKEYVAAVVKIGDALDSLSKFVAGQTLPQVMESYAIMTCLGQIMNGLTSSEGRKGLDARTIKQDAIDGSHRILAAFDHLRDTFEQRKNGERTAEIVDPEADYLKWKKEQGDE